MREMEVQEFVRRFKHILAAQTESRFAFFLGAGCSFTSGVQMAGGIVKNDWLPKLKEIKTGSDTDVETWAKNYLKKDATAYDGTNGALFYGEIIEELFITPESRQAEIERLTLGTYPGFGYAALAQLVSHDSHGKHCNFVLTTNFDDMIPDALYVYTNKKPLVIVHDSLVGFIKISSPRPVVIKLHGDARLSPRNTGDETRALDEKVKTKLQGLLAEMGLIFIGYGGNDRSIADILKGLPHGAPPHGIWWVNDRIPDGPFGRLLEERNAIWVKHLDFDELMLLIWKEFEFNHPENRFEQMMAGYRKTFEKLQSNIEAEPEEKKKKFADAVSSAISKAKDWWTVALEARKYEKKDSDKADRIYRDGVSKFNNSLELLGIYATFLWNIRQDYDGAEELFKKTLELEPSHANNNNLAIFGVYATFLWNIRRDYAAAEELYKKVLERDPTDVISNSNYANFLWRIRKDYTAAEDFYKKALELDLSHASNNGNYATFLWCIRQDYDRAEELYKKVLERDPNNVTGNGNYANFLWHIRRDYAAAEELFKKALELDPSHANNNGNYAGFLLAHGKTDEGYQKINKAMELAGPTINKDLILECLFYRYAHSKEETVKQESLQEMKTMLIDGVSSPGWDFSGNIKKAVEDGYPNPAFLEKLADVISEKSDISSLEAFDEWNKA